MKKFYKSLIIFFSIFLLLLAVKSPVHAAEPFLASLEHAETIPGKVHVTGYVQIQDEKLPNLFKFVTDLTNDNLWYPGVISVEPLSGNGKEGSTYHEVLNLGFGNMDITATVLGYTQNHFFKITSDGALANTTNFFFSPGEGGSSYLVIDSYVDPAPGVTTEAMQGYMQFTFANLLNTLGKQGTVTILQ